MAESASKGPESPADTSDVPSTAKADSPSIPFVKPPNPIKRPSVRHGSPDDRSPRPGKRARPAPMPMTAAAELQDRQRMEKTPTPSTQIQTPCTHTTPNPARQALSALMGVQDRATSSIRDGPSHLATTISEPLTAVAESIQEQRDDRYSESAVQTSPISPSSIGTLESNLALSGVDKTTMESPRSIGDAGHEEGASSPAKSTLQPPSSHDGPKSFSYPGPRLQPPMRHGHTMSLSGSDSRYPDRSSSSFSSVKKHVCPYCGSDFTRHHNLKSHLLTHSHEKPYVCQECDLRFRRLHDLKRHTKLHTGERPHICRKCGRRFARGDALARHHKGLSGCAGRRSSTGSFGGDDEYDARGDDSIGGIVYGEPEAMDEGETAGGTPARPSVQRPRQVSDVRGRAAAAADGESFQHRQPSTYPPVQGHRSLNGIPPGSYAPEGGAGGGASGPESSTSKPPQRGATSHPPPPGHSSRSHLGGGGGTGGPTFPPGSITESPKPLSPGVRQQDNQPEGVRLYNDRSSSLGGSQLHGQHQQQNRTSGRRSPPPMAPLAAGAGSQLPPPHPTSNLGLQDPRYPLAGQGPAHPPTGPTGPPTHMSGGNLSSHTNSLSSSHGQQSTKGSVETSAGAATAAMFNPREDRLWAYVKSLEDRVNGLHGEVVSLKDQLVTANNNNRSHNPNPAR